VHYPKTVKRYNLELNLKKKRGSKLCPINYTKTLPMIRLNRFLKAIWIKKIRLVISYKCLGLKVPGAPLHERIQLRIVPDKESGVSEVRFWYRDNFLGSQKVKNSDLNLVQF